MEFPNLGLLVIDEEQKFGVNQKEKLKVGGGERRRGEGEMRHREVLVLLRLFLLCAVPASG